MPDRRITVALALIVVLGLSAVAAGVGGASGVTTVDRNHPLTSETATQAYQSEGVVSGEVPGVNMSVTVADDASNVGLSEWQVRSSGRTFVRVQYHEQIEREIRFYLPSAYFEPRLRDGLESVDGGAEPVRLEPVDERQYTSVTIHVDGPTTAVYAVPSTRGMVASTREKVREAVNRTTGIDLPSLDSGGQQWQYIRSSEFDGDDRTTVAIETNNSDDVIQYDAADTGNERWVPVRTCEGSADEPVCTFQQSEHSNTTYILSTTEDPPPIRYKSDASQVSSVWGGVNDVVNGAKRVAERIGGVLPGGG
jgi:hypothetical protein